jgi:hypothetical protein
VGSVRHPSLKQIFREYKRCDSPLWGRDVSEINDELTSSLTSGGLPMRVPLGFSAQSTRSVHVLDLDREDAFEILLTEVCLGYYMLLCFRLPWHQPGMFARPSLLKQEFTLKSPVAQYLLAGFAHGQHWDLFERLVERRVELPDEASQKIFMSLAIAKKTDALEWLITCGAVVIHASFTLKSPIAQYLLAGFAQCQHYDFLGDGVRARLNQDAPNFIYDFSEKKDEHVRLEWPREHLVWHPTFDTHHAGWMVTRSYRFPEQSHINILEPREVIAELRESMHEHCR